MPTFGCGVFLWLTKGVSMWIFLPNAMLSVVEKPEDRGTEFLTVRGRVAGDIEAVFPGCVAKAGGGTDYAFRARIPREQVAKVMHDQAMNISYANFKSQVDDIQRHDAYMACWQAMYDLQRKKSGR